MRDMTVTLTVSVRVNADTWAETYGLSTEQEVREDLPQHLVDTVVDAVGPRLDPLVNGASLTGVRVDTVGIASDVLAAELVAEFPGEDYPFVRAWGEYMGSYDAYINEQVRKAQATNAPADAIYERDGVWSRAADIKNPHAIEGLRVILQRRKTA